MSVSNGMSNRALIAARIRRPSCRPGPRNDRPDVRLALSNDALKMNGTPTRALISTSSPARAVAWFSFSMTQGPAISANGFPPPIEMPRSVTAVTGSGHRLGRRPRHARHLVAISRIDERPKERMRPCRLRLEFRMELDREVPRMIRQLRDLDELAVRRPP